MKLIFISKRKLFYGTWHVWWNMNQYILTKTFYLLGKFWYLSVPTFPPNVYHRYQLHEYACNVPLHMQDKTSSTPILIWVSVLVVKCNFDKFWIVGRANFNQTQPKFPWVMTYHVCSNMKSRNHQNKKERYIGPHYSTEHQIICKISRT